MTPLLLCAYIKLMTNLQELIGTQRTYDATIGTTDWLTLSYAQLHDVAIRLARGLAANHVQPGSTILLFIDNRAELCILLWVAIVYRLTVIFQDPARLTPSAHGSLREMLKILRPSVVVVQRSTGVVSAEIAITALKLARPLGIILDEPYADWRTIQMLLADGDSATLDTASILHSARNDDQQRISSILFTSGTSGSPKGCPLTLRAQTHLLRSWSWLIDGRNASEVLQQAHNSRAIAPTQVLQTWVVGGTVIMPSRSFRVEDTVLAIEKFAASFVVLSPSMVHAIGEVLAEQAINTKDVRTIQIGGDAVTKDTLLRCAALFPDSEVCVYHGTSEGVAAFRWPFFGTAIASIPFLEETCPVGVVAPDSVLRLWNNVEQRIASRGEQGELHICSDSIIAHYLHGQSESSFYHSDDKRWFVTGDVPMIDESGLVFILGRAKDMIRRAGVVIMSATVESCIEKFIGRQRQTCVVGVPHPIFGQESYAIVSDLTSPASEPAIIAHVQSVLGQDYLLGGVFSLQSIGLNAFPVNATFKIVRPELERALQQTLQTRKSM